MAELVSPLAQAVPAGGGRRMAALGVARQLGRLRRRRGRQRIDDARTCRRPTARRTASRRPPAPRPSRRCRHRFDRPTSRQARPKLRYVASSASRAATAKIRFVDDQHGRDVLQMRARPVAIDQKPVRSGFRRHHDGEPVDVRGNRFGAAPRVDALDQIAARLDRFHGGSIGAGRERPADPVAAHHPLLASLERAVQGAIRRSAPARRVRSSRAPRRCRACLSTTSL